MKSKDIQKVVKTKYKNSDGPPKSFRDLESKDIQKVVKTKYKNSDGPPKSFRDLAGAVSLPTIKLWIKMINTTGSITLSSPPGCPRTVRTNAAIVKNECTANTPRKSWV
ncbi:unnamed protein product [Rotaria magnacalcarata]|uniref:Uncharacterized protein n=1 Tax=Rotaria magnacalcarata TaxID=392030 RepID=A0A8S2KTF5_9BILA|nr:unnamed protein product [Rotaria magnacalcarata]